MKAIAKTLIELYRGGFRSMTYTVISWTVKQHFNSRKRYLVFSTISELGIPLKIKWLCRILLRNAQNFVNNRDLCEAFRAVRSLRQDNPLSSSIFNFAVKSVLQKGTLFCKQCLNAYAYRRHRHE